jgi:hypothetical protein
VEQPTLLPLFLVVALAIVLDVLPTYAPTPRALPRSPWSCRARAEQPPARWRRRFLRRSRLAPRRGRHMRLFRTCSGCPSPRRPRCPPRSLAAALRAPHPAPSHLPTPLPTPWPSRAGVVPIPTSAASPSRAHALSRPGPHLPSPRPSAKPSPRAQADPPPPPDSRSSWSPYRTGALLPRHFRPSHTRVSRTVQCSLLERQLNWVQAFCGAQAAGALASATTAVASQLHPPLLLPRFSLLIHLADALHYKQAASSFSSL